MNFEELQARALAEPEVTWKNTRCIRVHSHGEIVGFMAWHGGFVYRTSKEQWDAGKLTEVH